MRIIDLVSTHEPAIQQVAELFGPGKPDILMAKSVVT